jgi:fluoroacetyl-CoA thioesterase
MKSTLSPGLMFTEHHTVDEARCITFMGREAMVYATPSMVSDAEYACHAALLPHLDPGENSVGTHVSIDHLRPAPLGARVRVDVRVESVDHRRVTFVFSVHDALDEIGRGRHTRFVVDSAKTIDRVAAKRAALQKADAIRPLD